MKSDFFKLNIGKTEKNEEYFLDLLKMWLVADKSKDGQVELFQNAIKHLQKTDEELQIALVDYENKNYEWFEDDDKLFLPIAHIKEDAIMMFDFLKKVQDARKALLKKCYVKNIEEYNQKEPNKIPYIFVFVDEAVIFQSEKNVKNWRKYGKLCRICWKIQQNW